MTGARLQRAKQETDSQSRVGRQTGRQTDRQAVTETRLHRAKWGTDSPSRVGRQTGRQTGSDRSQTAQRQAGDRLTEQS